MVKNGSHILLQSLNPPVNDIGIKDFMKFYTIDQMKGNQHNSDFLVRILPFDL